MKALILLLSLFFSYSFSYAQKFQKAELEMFDGTKKSGLINSKSLMFEDIIFKTTEESDSEKIAAFKILKINFNVHGQVHTFENVAYAYAEGWKKKLAWMVKLEEGFYDLFTHAIYSFTKDGDLVFSAEYIVGRTLPSMGYYIRKHDSKEAYQFAIYSSSPTFLGLHNVLRKSVAKYMADDPELVEKVSKKKLSTKNVEQIVREYNQFKQKN